MKAADIKTERLRVLVNHPMEARVNETQALAQFALDQRTPVVRGCMSCSNKDCEPQGELVCGISNDYWKWKPFPETAQERYYGCWQCESNCPHYIKVVNGWIVEGVGTDGTPHPIGGPGRRFDEGDANTFKEVSEADYKGAIKGAIK